ncbi:hypothetical protein [Streptomyces sp. L-9-10]|uniref:hypothetical protein n=2 Tax=unclassified Streptomyces TaxID=2593676 RepID=UPI00195F78A9|nr:hypothetical protein [Streptomyces sp. L-9-10]
MSEVMSDQIQDVSEAEVEYAMERCVVDHTRFPAARRCLARDVIRALLLAGLSTWDRNNHGVGHAGAALSARPDGTVAVLWMQHPAVDQAVPRDVRTTQQSAIYRALRTILEVHGFPLREAGPEPAPILLGRAA